MVIKSAKAKFEDNDFDNVCEIFIGPLYIFLIHQMTPS